MKVITIKASIIVQPFFNIEWLFSKGMIGLPNMLKERRAIIVLHIILPAMKILIEPFILSFRKGDLELQVVFI